MLKATHLSQNAFSIFIGRSIILFLTFLSITLAARYLGVEQFGRFSSLTSLLFILSRLIDFGFTQIAFREISKQTEAYSYIDNSISLRLIFFVIVFVSYNIVAFVFNFELSEVMLTDILFLNIIISPKFMNFRDLLELPFRIKLKMHIVMIIYIMENVLLLIFILLMPAFNGGIFYFIIAYVISNIPGFVLTIYYLKRNFNYSFRFNLSKSRWLIVNSLPLLGYGIFNAIFQQSDVLLLRLFDSDYSAGLYGAALRLSIPLGIIPISIVTTIYPTVVRNLTGDIKKALFINHLINKILFIFSFLAAILVSFKSEEIVTLLFGTSYLKSSSPLILLFWSYVFVFFNNYYVDILTAENKQKFNFIFSLLVSFVDIFILIYLVDRFSFSAAGIAKLVASSVGCIYIYFVYRSSEISLNFFNRSLILWGLLVVIMSYLLDGLNLYLFLLTTIIFSTLLVLIINVLSNQELLVLLKSINKEEWLLKIKKIQMFQS